MMHSAKLLSAALLLCAAATHAPAATPDQVGVYSGKLSVVSTASNGGQVKSSIDCTITIEANNVITFSSDGNPAILANSSFIVSKEGAFSLNTGPTAGFTGKFRFQGTKAIKGDLTSVNNTLLQTAKFKLKKAN